ncbi:MAG: hypothetical protein M3094_08335 [Actinomycetia bacterium]|nr:hypothetical protein [Actinomycetes bacterium]
MKKPDEHTLFYCTTTDQKIKQSKQFIGLSCPHCDAVLPPRGETVDPNAPAPIAIQMSTTDSIPGYRILQSHGIVFVQAPNRYQGLGTSGFDSKQATKTTSRLLETMLPSEVGAKRGNAVVGVRVDVHDTFTIVYGTAVTVEAVD